MDNEIKLSSEQIKSIMQDMPAEPEKEKADIGKLMDKHLNEKQKQAVSQIMENPERLKAILDSPIAQKLLRQLEKKDGNKE